MKNPFRILSKNLNKFENPGKSKDLQNSQNPMILETLGISMDDAIDNWISIPLDREKLLKELNSLSGKDLEICKNILEDRLKKESVKVLFGNDVKFSTDFSWGDIDYYSRYYLWNTDFGNDLANQNVFIQKVGGKGFNKNIFLSLQNRINRGENEVRVNFPFIQQYHKQSDSYKFDVDDVDIKYVGKKDKTECVVNLIDFLQKIQKCSKGLSKDRKLGVFGENRE